MALERITQGDTDAKKALSLRVYHLVENYEGATLDTWSTCHGQEATCLEGGNANVAGGYGRFVASLADGLDVRYNAPVRSIDQDSSGVTVTLREGEVVQARFAVVAVPLGVLQHRDIGLNLPSKLYDCVDRLGISVMNKIVLRFATRWWPQGVGSISIAASEDPLWNQYPWYLNPSGEGNETTLVCFVTGRFAMHVETLSDAATVQEALDMLRRYGLQAPEPEEAFVSRWVSDPWARGSWTYYKVGSSSADVAALGRPIGRVALAGEHTAAGEQGMDIGTVHGAWLSGFRAAEHAGTCLRPQ
mmetsp:Transcript_23109/g.56158  ORF Transcript_23109/g.56158 Transcript_23109/m.56158 type:complete len:302 (-) Transcript_23109:79-984(-)